MNTEHTNQSSLSAPVPHSHIDLQSIPDRQRSFTAENIRDIAHDCIRIGDNDQAEVVFAIADALRDGNLIIKQQAEPVAWVRFCSDGCYEGPLMNSSPAMDGARRTSGAWTPLFAAQPVARDVLMALAKSVESELIMGGYVALTESQLSAIVDRHTAQPPAVAVPGSWHAAMSFARSALAEAIQIAPLDRRPHMAGAAMQQIDALLSAALQAAVATGWIDPNDKSQKQFLPHIGEPVLFCHDGVTYYGIHTGGSFKTGQGVTAKTFGTWDCLWMYPPAAAQKGGA